MGGPRKITEDKKLQRMKNYTGKRENDVVGAEKMIESKNLRWIKNSIG